MRRKGIAGPAILVALGIIFLLNNFGYLPWEIWGTIWRFWPVVLIIVGLEILFQKTSSGKFLILIAFLVFVLPLLLSGVLPKELSGKETLEISQKLGTLVMGNLEVNLPTGDLTIEPSASFSAQLVEGEITYNRVTGAPQVDFIEDEGRGNFKLKAGNLGGSVRLKANPNVPINLNLSSGASRVNLNLENLQIPELKLETGASKVTINFSKTGPTKAEIVGKAAAIEIKIPKELEVKIHPESSALNLDLDKDRFKKNGDSYYSEGYREDIKNKLDLELKTSVASVTIR